MINIKLPILQNHFLKPLLLVKTTKIIFPATINQLGKNTARLELCWSGLTNWTLLNILKQNGMKKIIIFVMLFAFAKTSFSQQSAPKQHWTDTEYYKKSKKQKTAAWILTGVGSAVLLTTLITDAFSSAISGFEKSASGIAIPYAIGAACVATGVVLFVASSKNKKKAKSTTAFFRMEKIPVHQLTRFNNQSVPAIGMRVSL